ncbi:MAG: hypothetical protein AB1665_00815 [Candidatus Thermoplasmatota archaeon]
MLPEDHLKKAMRIKTTCEKLDPETDWETIIEDSYGIALHIIAYLSQKRLGVHMDTHKGLTKFLDDHNMRELSALFRELDGLRSGRWYGGKSDGDAARRAKAITQELGKIVASREGGGNERERETTA